jgi:O-antigen ligase
MQGLIVADLRVEPHLSGSISKLPFDRPNSAGFLLPILLGTVALVPLPLGGNRPWVWEILGAIIGLQLIILGSYHLRHPEARRTLRPLRLPASLFAIVIIWTAVQCLPFTPEAWHHPLWSQAQDYFDGKIVTSISIDRIASISRIFRLTTYAGIFWLSYALSQDSQRARIVVKVVALIVGLYAAWGLIVYWTGNTRILWFQKWAYETDLTGTFVNRNSFATFLGLGLLACVALILEGLRKQVDFRESSRGILKATLELLIVRARWLTLAALGAGTALLLTHSRGGAISTVLGLLAFLTAVSVAPSLRARWHMIFGLGLLVTLGMMVIISDNITTERLAESSIETEGRTRIFELTLEAIHDWPVFGTGLGTFRDVFPLYRTEDLSLPVAQAHNDYLETIVELGLPAASALFLSMASLLWICLRGAQRRRRDAVFPCIGVGVTTLVAVHSLFDFSLQMPGVAALYWLLMGAAIAQSFSSSHSSE